MSCEETDNEDQNQYYDNSLQNYLRAFGQFCFTRSTIFKDYYKIDYLCDVHEEVHGEDQPDWVLVICDELIEEVQGVSNEE
jgi:hypothetical protein